MRNPAITTYASDALGKERLRVRDERQRRRKGCTNRLEKLVRSLRLLAAS